MPMYDLDGRYRPKRLGKVRLGRTREKKIKGQVVNIPYATPFFVLDDMPEEIRKEYGEEPAMLNIEFLFNTIEEVFPHFHTYYLKRGLRCLGDGEMVLYRVAGPVDEPVVYIHGGAITENIEDELLEEWAKEYGTTDPMGNSLRCLGFDCPRSEPGKCRPKGRLCFAIRGHAALGYYEMGTGSINAIAGIVSQLKLCLMTFGHFTAIPWELHLSPETVQVGGKSMTIYVPWIRIETDWMQRHFPAPVRALHLRAAEEQKAAAIVDLYGKEDVEDLEFTPTPQALIEAAQEEEAKESTRTAQEAVDEAATVIEGKLAEMQSDNPPEPSPAPAEEKAEEQPKQLEQPEPPQQLSSGAGPEAPSEAPEITTEKGNLFDRLLKDANHNIKKRKGKPYNDVDEVRRALEAGGVEGMLDPDKYSEYLDIVLDAKGA